MKKILFSLILLALAAAELPALPGFDTYIPDSSGEYVIYKDNTFTRESYLGILYYNETSLQIKYFAPEADGLSKKEIALLISLVPDSARFELNGERILSTIQPDSDDTEIVNYLHDILYEFSGRRSKADDVTPGNKKYVQGKGFHQNGLKLRQDYVQFGGDVTVVFDCLVPVFNLKDILGADGKPVLECKQIGRLDSMGDKSFDAFFPIQPVKPDVKLNSVKPAKARPLVCEAENQKITLDENWQQQGTGCWTLGEDAVINLNVILPPDGDEEKYGLYILRLLLESASEAYIDLDTCEILQKGREQYKLTTYSYLGSNDREYISIKILTRNPQTGETYFFSFASKNETYVGKRSYFDKLIKSYTVTKSK